MRERGSISPLRGYQPSLTPDIYVEKVGRNVYLGTPATRAGVDWLGTRLRARAENIFFCNGVILNDNDVRWLLTNPKSIRVRVEIYPGLEETC